MTEFAFDLKMNAAIRVEADTEEQARAILAERLEAADTNFGAFPDGSPILGEASLTGEPKLYEIDGEAPASEPETETQEFTLLLATTVRAFGHATVTASSPEEAAEIVRAATSTHSGPWDDVSDVDWSTVCEPNIIRIDDEAGETVSEDIDLYPADNAHDVISAEALAELFAGEEK